MFYNTRHRLISVRRLLNALSYLRKVESVETLARIYETSVTNMRNVILSIIKCSILFKNMYIYFFLMLLNFVKNVKKNKILTTIMHTFQVSDNSLLVKYFTNLNDRLINFTASLHDYVTSVPSKQPYVVHVCVMRRTFFVSLLASISIADALVRGILRDYSNLHNNFNFFAPI